MFVGTRKGTGVIARQDFNAGIGAFKTTSNLNTATTNITTSSTHFLYVDAPTNGMAQFKGLTASTTEKTYVQVICVGVMPVYATWAVTLSTGTTTTGFIVNCYTGIPQCTSSLADSITYLNTSSATTVVSSCMADPRYLTWRSFVLKI